MSRELPNMTATEMLHAKHPPLPGESIIGALVDREIKLLCATPIKFASEADQRAWEIDFMAFGSAITDQDGKHVPLKDVIIDRRRD